MSIQNDLVADFAHFAKLQLDDHTEQLKERYRSKEASAESFRLQVFNEHFQALKKKLNDKIADMTINASADANAIKSLERKYSQYINDFLKRDFNALEQ